MNPLRAAVTGKDIEADGWPTVTVVMPVRNEASNLDRAVGSILEQEYPRPFTVCLAIAPSTDDTAAIADSIAARDARVSVVQNPKSITPSALNAAIASTQSDVVVRVDGHSRLSGGYIQQAVETMIATGAVNVGGVQHAEGDTPFERAVATSMRSWVGTGGAKFHVGGRPGPVDTVYLGVFDRAAGDQVGWFDERLIRNQDYELNIRLRAAGGTVWFDPNLVVSYRPRGTWRSLARQYFEYGYWKAEVIRMHPGSLKLRQVAPAGLVAVFVGLLVHRPARFIGALVAYGVGLGVLVQTRHRALGAVIAGTQQLAWGLGALTRIVSWLGRRTPR